MIILLPLLFIWSRAPMKYGFMSKAFILGFFCFAAMLVVKDAQVPALIDSVKAADNWDEELGEEEDPRIDPSRPRLREGTRIASVIGKFSRVGRRWTLELEPADESTPPVVKSNQAREQSSKDSSTVSKNQAEVNADEQVERSTSKSAEAKSIRYRVLENLTLQRVADAIAQDPNDVRWVVSGTITEFDGENWLLLSTVFRAHATIEAVSTP
jgi:hypothetical protein